MPPKIDLKLCNSCGLCDKICPGDIIHMDEPTNLPVVVYPDECWYCGNCEMECAPGAIKIVFPLSMLV